MFENSGALTSSGDQGLFGFLASDVTSASSNPDAPRALATCATLKSTTAVFAPWLDIFKGKSMYTKIVHPWHTKVDTEDLESAP